MRWLAALLGCLLAVSVAYYAQTLPPPNNSPSVVSWPVMSVVTVYINSAQYPPGSSSNLAIQSAVNTAGNAF